MKRRGSLNLPKSEHECAAAEEDASRAAFNRQNSARASLWHRTPLDINASTPPRYLEEIACMNRGHRRSSITRPSDKVLLGHLEALNTGIFPRPFSVLDFRRLAGYTNLLKVQTHTERSKSCTVPLTFTTEEVAEI